MAKPNTKQTGSLDFTQVPIPLCGDEYYFKRCSNETLKSFDEKIEQRIKEIKPLTDESTELNEKTDRLNSKIDSLKGRISLMERKDDLSDDEIAKTLEYHDKLDALYEELDEHLKVIKEFNDKTDGLGDELNKDINRIIAEKVEAIVDGITADEFLKKHDNIDMHIADNISKYYEMCMIGEKASKIKQEIRDDCDEFRKRQKENRQ